MVGKFSFLEIDQGKIGLPLLSADLHALRWTNFHRIHFLKKNQT